MNVPFVYQEQTVAVLCRQIEVVKGGQDRQIILRYTGS